ncbi:MAG: CvpA family protein [Armatimonadetes bacterium]|nr:CvpA family protein [Armatimonadota bacterium]
MNWIDYALIAIGLMAFLQGARRGWPRALLGVVGLLAGFGVALLWYPSLGEIIGRNLRPLPRPWVNTVAFILLVAAGDLGGLLLGLLLAAPRKRASVGFRIFGGALGLAKGGVWATIVLVILLASPLASYAAKDVEQARVAPYLLQAERWTINRLIAMKPERFSHLSPRLKF